MQFKYACLALAQASLILGWELVVYDNVEGCNANGDTTYRIYESTFPEYNHCINFRDSYSNGRIKCSEYRNGGNSGPFACSGGFVDSPDSYDFHPLTKVGGEKEIANLQQYDGHDCTSYAGINPMYNGSPVNRCTSGPEAVSFKVVKYGTEDY